MAIVVKLPPEVVLRCTTKLVSSLELSVQFRLILLDDVAVAPKPVGAVGGVVGSESGVPSPPPQADSAVKSSTEMVIFCSKFVIIDTTFLFLKITKIASKNLRFNLNVL